ncbi:putative transferase CAF17 homolog, mitochondrial [Teleopsis dalmanni]|uniref:putative transferase CAF17 homolog, mitochondrial n=1 Tax=Teleopsis dalmanni TaxID=139649 RepID=UPI0018CED92F|nr:putative transferase CAF17 homolog, mitochondrial [Teleopsis dalmanni]XP_037951068.1 putative transferase CAF17 homolog, mitochondrial [Teleopsis dalmanni]
MQSLKKLVNPFMGPNLLTKCLRTMTKNIRGLTQDEGPSGKTRLIIEPLTDRELIRVSGKEVVPFLQGLTTNDMKHLNSDQSLSNDSMYTMFLNKAGRILYDSIIYRTKDVNTFLIECDKGISEQLRQHLRLYRVRRKIVIEAAGDKYKPWIVFNPDDGDINFDSSGVIGNMQFCTDPRIRELGVRVIAGVKNEWDDIAEIFSEADKVTVSPPTNDCNYRIRRYKYGVGEGVTDLPPGKCFPLEANGDYLHGVSFQKGCYIGQELTARVYHTGTIRKRFMPIRLTAPVSKEVTTVQLASGANIGTIRGISRDRAIGLLRVEQALGAPKLLIDGADCYVEKPKWWPAESRNPNKI